MFGFRAKKLLEVLKSEETLSWNSHGVLSVSGIQQPGLNIITLLKICNYKVTNVTNGQDYYMLMKRLNLLKYVVNKDLLAEQDRQENQDNMPW